MSYNIWGLGIGPNPQSPIPNPQSPIPILPILYLKYFFYLLKYKIKTYFFNIKEIIVILSFIF